MRAVILAGGKGTRLKPYTLVLPKPLMPIGDFTILEIVVRQLAYHGFSHITMAVNHQAELIRAFFGNGSKWNIDIDYSFEDKPLGTMGPLKLIKDLPEDFLIMNGDILTNLNFAEFYNSHVCKRNFFTIASYHRDEKCDYGILETDKDNKLTGFQEKPIVRFNVSMGIYIANREVLDYIPNNQLYGFDHLMINLIRCKKPARVETFNGYWLDIGRPDDYMRAIDEFEENKENFLKIV